MEELEGVIILKEQHSKTILNINDEKKKKSKNSLQSDHIIITAGNKGVLRILHVSIAVRENMMKPLLFVIVIFNWCIYFYLILIYLFLFNFYTSFF
jgi:hypothetical protein